MQNAPITPEVEFLSESHEYVADGIKYPSVTQIIGDCGLISTWYTKGSAKRGSDIHELIADYLRGCLDLSTVTDDGFKLIGKLQVFLDREVKEVIAVEKPMIRKDLGYSGTPDIIFETKSGETVLIDWKSGGSAIWHPVQSAAYLLMARVSHPIEKAGIVYMKNGWGIEWVEDEPNYTARFMSMLDLYQFKHGRPHA